MKVKQYNEYSIDGITISDALTVDENNSEAVPMSLFDIATDTKSTSITIANASF